MAVINDTVKYLFVSHCFNNFFYVYTLREYYNVFVRSQCVEDRYESIDVNKILNEFYSLLIDYNSLCTHTHTHTFLLFKKTNKR